jgi:signal transduction histidine kinase
VKTFNPARAYRGGYWIGWILIPVVFLLLVIYVPWGTMLARPLPLLAVFSLLYLASPFLLARVAWFRLLYFPIQACLVFALGLLAIDGTNLLYFPLCLQAPHAFGRRTAPVWMLIYSALLALTLFSGKPFWEALALLLLFLAVGSFLVSYDVLYTRTQQDQAESRLLLENLQEAHCRLQEHAARAEELAAMRERNRLARELHDSVSQTVFSIRLTAQAARLALQSDAARLPEQLERLQEMTASALAQLRSLIAELHPR